MAELLLDTLSGPFEPSRYRDEYRERLLAMINDPEHAGREYRVETRLVTRQSATENRG